MLDVYCILYFPHLLGGFLHICTLYMYYICGLWPPDNVSCLFPTWYQSIGLAPARCNSVLPPPPPPFPGRRRSATTWPAVDLAPAAAA
jgi:hypothetical protein